MKSAAAWLGAAPVDLRVWDYLPDYGANVKGDLRPDSLTIDNYHLSDDDASMILSFRHKGLRRLFEHNERKGIRPDLIEKIENVLTLLNRARSPNDMTLPGYRLHPLKGDLNGFWSVTVRANWRVIFRFKEGHALDVDLVDYH